MNLFLESNNFIELRSDASSSTKRIFFPIKSVLTMAISEVSTTVSL